MKFFFSIVIPLALGAIAGYATATYIDSWYLHLQKPVFNPPNKLFAPVWTVLYLSMGFASYIIWRQTVTPFRNRALVFFYAQLLINFAWSFLFFVLHRIGWALIDISLLWILLLTTIFLFSSFSRIAAWILVPYLLWVSFALVLNASIYYLNR